MSTLEELLPAMFRALDKLGPTTSPGVSWFQRYVDQWMQECFGPAVTSDMVERNHRFLEESLELVQAMGATKEEALLLVDYVFDRPMGAPAQEVGGVMVTLAALCNAANMDMDALGDRELIRCWAKIPEIRAKQATKPMRSPLPGKAP